MKNRLIPFVLFILALGIGAILMRPERGASVGSAAPNFTLSDLNGRTYTLSDLRGRVVFLNIWATWCLPCRTEMPAMETLYQQLERRAFTMLAVSQDADGAASVAPFAKQLGLSFPVLLDPTGSLYSKYGLTGLPETFIIDQDGTTVRHTVGPDSWASEELIRYILALLDRSPVIKTAAGSGGH